MGIGKKILFVLPFLFLFSIYFLGLSHAYGSEEMGIDAVDCLPGETVTVPIYLTNVTGPGNLLIHINISFDPSVVHIEYVTGQSPFFLLASYTSNEKGFSNMILYSPVSYQGNFTFAQLALFAVGDPLDESPLAINIINVGYNFSCRIFPISHNGTFFINSFFWKQSSTDLQYLKNDDLTGIVSTKEIFIVNASANVYTKVLGNTGISPWLIEDSDWYFDLYLRSSVSDEWQLVKSHGCDTLPSDTVPVSMGVPAELKAVIYYPVDFDTALVVRILPNRGHLYCVDTMNYPESGVVKIDDELIRYSSKSYSGILDGIERGYSGTTPAFHSTGTKVSLYSGIFNISIMLSLDLNHSSSGDNNTSHLSRFHNLILSISEGQPPAIDNITASPNPQEYAGYINITCGITDISGVTNAAINITYPDSTIGNYSLSQMGSSNIWYYNATYIHPGVHTYSIWANDTSGNGNVSPVHSFTIQDGPPPIYIVDVIASLDLQNAGGYVNISCNVMYQYSGMDSMNVNTWLNVTYPDLSIHNETMMKINGTDIYYLNSTYHLPGVYDYYIWSNDTLGNNAVSPQYCFIIEKVTVVKVIPSYVSVIKEHCFTINISINSTEPIMCAQLDVSFNHYLLTASYVSNGGFFDSFLTAPLEIDNENGEIRNIIGYSNDACSTEGIFAIIHFKSTTNCGTSFVNLSGVLMGNESGYSVPVDIRNGKVDVNISRGDVNGDGHVNIFDIIYVGQSWGETGIPGWIPADVKKDGVINIFDILLIILDPCYSHPYYYPPPPPLPIPLSATLSSSVINMTNAVDANGAVATETSVNFYLNITNLATKNTSIAEDVTLELEDPITSQDGLPTALEKTYTRIDYVDISGSTYPLYYNGVYHGVGIGNIEPGSIKVCQLRATFKVAPAGTYVDGQTYNWYLWYNQPNAGDYAIQVSGTLTT